MSTQNHEVWYNGSTPMFLADGAKSITISPQTTGSNVVLTNSNGVFQVNGQPQGDVAEWSLYPTISNTIKMDASNNITNVGSNLYFNGNLIANASDIQNIGDWSLYNALSDVSLSNGASNYSIVGAKNITAISNISAGSMNTGSLTSSGAVSGTIGTFTTTLISPSLSNTGNVVLVANTGNLTAQASSILTTSAPTISNTFTNAYNILGNRGSDYSDFCYTNLSNTGGKGGSINLTADAGSVTISGTTYGVGGQINLTANSPLTVPYNLTSAIKLSAASVLSYAGAVSPLGSLAGYNYIQATLGVNIVAGTASALPNTAGTVYLYGLNGTKIQNSLYVDNISNYPGANLNIHPDSSQWVDILRCQKLGMGNNAVIDGGGGTTSFISNFYGISTTANGGLFTGTGGISTQGSITNGLDTPLYVSQPDLNLYAYKTQSGIAPVTYVYHNINLTSSSNINLNTANGGQVLVNGSAIDAANLWYTYPALGDVDMSNHYLVNVAGIDGLNFSNLVETPMVKGLDANNFNMSNLATLLGGSNLAINAQYSNPFYIRNAVFGGQVNLIGGSNGGSLSIGQSNFDLYASNSPLTLRSSSAIVMSNTLNMSNNSITNASNITTSNITTSTINGGGVFTNPLTSALNMSNYNITNASGILSGSSITISPTTTLYVTTPLDMGANGITNCSGVTATAGSLTLNSASTISAVRTLDMNTNGISNVGALNGVATLNGRTPFSTPAPLSLDMASNVISNVAGIYANTGVLYGQGLTLSNNGGYVNTIAQGGAMITANTGITLTAGTSTPPTPIGASNIQAYAPLTMYLQAGALSGGVPYHSITMSQSSPMYIGSSNAISLNATSNIYLNSDTYRSLSGTPVYQGTQQYGTFSNLGTGGSFSVTFNYPYSASYYITLTNTTSNTALQYSAVKTSLSNFTLYYGGGSAISTTYIDWVATGK